MDFADKYTEKQIHIFEGVMTLLREGRQIHDLKVADIAGSAGMGKSTAYEYFTSKDEIIREALTFHLRKNFLELTTYIFSEKTFGKMMQNALDHLEQSLENRFTGVFMILLTQKHDKKNKSSFMDEEMRLKLEEVVIDQMIKALKIGQKEGQIGGDITLAEFKMVVFGLFSAYVHELFPLKISGCILEPLKVEDDLNREEIAELKKRTLMLILKALR